MDAVKTRRPVATILLRSVLTKSLPMSVAVVMTTVAIVTVHSISGFGGQNLHSMLEVVATMLSLVVGVLSLVRYLSRKNATYLFLSSGFLGTAFLDGYHLLVTSSQFSQLMPSRPESLGPWSWSASRTFLGVWMVLTWLGTANLSRGRRGDGIRESSVWITGAALTLITALLFAWLPLPRAHFPGWFFSRPQELLAGILFATALAGFISTKHEEKDSFLKWLQWSLLVGCTTQIAVMARSESLFDLPFHLAHLLRIFSYALVLGGLLAEVSRTFRGAEESRAVQESLTAELQESEGRFQRAVTGSTDGMWDFDVCNGEVWYSDRFKQLLGFEPGEGDDFANVLDSWASRLHPADRDDVMKAVDNHLKNGLRYDVKYRLRLESGERRWFRSRGQAEWDHDGAPIRMSGSLSDIHNERTIEERLDLAIRAANEGLWDWEIKSGTTYFNDTFYTMLGYHPGEFPMDLQVWRDLIHPDDSSTVERLVADHLSGKSSSYRHEHRLRRKDGAWHWILGIGEIVERDQDDQPLRMIGVHVDIQNLKEISTRLELAHTSANAGIWDWNVVANTFVSNATLHTMIGEDPLQGDIPIDYLLSRIHLSELQSIQHEIAAAQASDSHTYDIEFQIRCSDGAYKWMRSTGKVIERCPDGRALRMIGQHIDVTQQKELEASLRESRNLADTVNQDLVSANIIQHVLFTCRTEQEVGETITNVLVEKFGAQFAGLWLKPTTGGHASGVDDGLQLTASCWRSTTGDPRHDSQPPSVTDIERIATADWDKTVVDDLSEQTDLFDSGWIESHEVKSFAGFPLLLHGVVIGFVGNFSKKTLPTHRLETLELMAQMTAVAIRNVQQIAELWTARRAAEEASMAKSEFLANMSHEIRTPMTAILGYADVLTNEEDCDGSIDRETAVETIRNNGNHLLNIINDVLDVSKIEAGRMTVETISTNPAAILHDIKTLLEPRAAAKDVTLDVSSNGLIPWAIDSDPTRLRQILLNLVGNAIKFTESGTIAIVASMEESDGCQQMRFAVTDSGIGMTPEQCDKIRQFDAFTQADGSTTRQFGGSGLGLRISNALARLLGGRIEIDSEQGRGSTFSVSINAGDVSGVDKIEIGEGIDNQLPKYETPKVADVGSMPLGGSRILLAEDGQDNQRLICFLLKKAGANVVVAENGRVCLDLVDEANTANEPFDIILMDMQMPEMDGYEATRQLRACEYSGTILALTANAMSEDRQKCIDAGCDEFLTKPIDRAELIEKCRRELVATVE